ncbi:MAG: GIY-YIG nuclease family protein [Caldilineaceae bacterium]|nr:GIY-YIG nuclease family protein [Caldilineaceae bacterium]
MVKIGLTTRAPETRAKEVSGATGVPTPFEIAHQRRVKDCFAVEQAIHRQLDRYRVGRNREFFQMSLNDAKRAVDTIAVRYERLDAPIARVHWLLRLPLWLLFWWILGPLWLWKQGVIGKAAVGLAVVGLLFVLLHEPTRQVVIETATPIVTSAAVTLQPLLPIGGPAPVATPAPTATLPAETPTPAPTATIRPSNTPAVTPSAGTATANQNANLHVGPGTDFAVTGVVQAGEVLTIVGRTPAADWYQLAGGHWIAADSVVNAPDDIPVSGTVMLTRVPSDER